MSDVKDLSKVKEVFYAMEEANPDIFYDIPYAGTGEFASEGEEGLPEGWTISIFESNTERDYDSYGNAYTEDGYVVFLVSDGEDEQLYLLPVSYASYEGWDRDLSRLVKTEKKEKVVTTWEWTR